MTEPTSDWLEHAVLSIEVYMLVSALMAILAGGGVFAFHMLSNPAPPTFYYPVVRVFMAYGALLGLLMVSIGRISARTYSLLPCRGLFLLVVTILGVLVIYVLGSVTGSELVGETEEVLALAYPSFPVFVIFGAIGFHAWTETVLMVARRNSRVVRRVPIQLFTDKYETFEEREFAIGHQEIVSEMVRAVRETEAAMGVNCIRLITVDAPQDLLDALAPHARVTRIITTRQIAKTFRDNDPPFGDVVETMVPGVGQSWGLGNRRFIIVNDSVMMVYTVIPPHEGEPANIGFVDRSPWRIQEYAAHFDLRYEVLSRRRD